MNEAFGILIIGILVGSFVRWIYLHWRFRAVLREEKPELAKHLRAAGMPYSLGAEWVDFALLGKHRTLGSERLRQAGDTLVRDHGKFQISWAILWVVLAVLFGVSLWLE